MDLQAILDATDSSSEDDDDDNNNDVGRMYPNNNNSSSRMGLDIPTITTTSSPSLIHHSTTANSKAATAAFFKTPPRQRRGGPTTSSSYNNNNSPPTSSAMSPWSPAIVSSNNIDLEQILREDDDDDDDTDDDDDLSSSNEFWTSSSGSHLRSKPTTNTTSAPTSTYSYYSSTMANPQQNTTTTTTTTNPEDWDVLQAILGEDDDDDDDDSGDDDDDYSGDEDDEDDLELNLNGYSYSSNKQKKKSRHVNRILQDDMEMLLVDSKPTFPPPPPTAKSSTATANKRNHNNSTTTLELQDSYGIGVDSFVTAHQEEQDQDQDQEDNATTTVTKRKQQQQQQDVYNYYYSSQALQYAQSYEKKLFKAGHRDIVSPLQVKRRLKPKIEIGGKTQQTKHKRTISHHNHHNHNNNTSNHRIPKLLSSAARFNFSGGTVEDKPMAILSRTLSDFSHSVAKRTKYKTLALPTAVAVNARFIAVGLQTGSILAFDLFESLRQKLELTDQFSQPNGISSSTSSSSKNSTPRGSVTSIDLSLDQGEFLIAGYTSGHVVLWDTIKGVALKSIVETTSSSSNPSPISSVRFLQNLKIVTVDAAGLVNTVAFTKTLLWNSYSVETECLLDGTAGQILAMNVLPPYAMSNASKPQQQQQQHPYNTKQKQLPALFQSLVLIALSSERSSFAVAVEPKVHVLHRWAKPSPERMESNNNNNTQNKNENDLLPSDQVYLPCLSWGWALVSGGGHMINPILARAWGCCLQLLRANFPEDDNDDDDNDGDGHHDPRRRRKKGVGSKKSLLDPTMIDWPAFGVHDEFDADAPVVALEWLNDRSLVYLTVHNEFTVIDTVMMTLLERLDFSGVKLVYAEFSLSRKVTQDASSSQQQQSQMDPNFCTTFQNSVRSCDDRILLLCQDELKSVSIVGAKRRISGLEQDGEWLEALALALDHYENTIKSQEDRRRLKNKQELISKHAHFNQGAKSEDEEWIAKLLVRYLNIAVENAPDTSTTTTVELPREFLQSQLELAQSHFQMLAGVCVEFCVTTKRLDLLFGPIFGRFASVGYLSTFLDVLEPYILNDKLDYIAPEAMAHFVEHCRATNGIATVERCLLHMDVTIMDFDSILALLKANEMYSALFYVYNQGLNDYTAPLEVLSDKLFDAADTTSLVPERRPDGVPQNEFELYGYKALLYLQSCFRGRFFPQDTEMPEEMVPTVRSQLLQLLLRRRYSQRDGRRKKEVIGQRALQYPYTHILLMVDPNAMFDTMSIAMDAPDEEFGATAAETDSMGGWEAEGGEQHRSPERQDIVSMFMSIIIPEKEDIATTHQSTLHQSKAVVNAFLDFLADYLVKGMVAANQVVTLMILNRMAERYQAAKNAKARQESQSQILQLLTALPRSSYDAEEVLALMHGAGIHRAALLMHQEGASYWEGSRDAEKRASHFRSAIDCYLGDADVNFRKEVFAYVKKECSASPQEDDEEDQPTSLADDEDDMPGSMRDALASKLSDLVHLDPLLTAELVAELFVDDLDRVIANLRSENARFKFLQAIISGKLNELDQVAGAVLNSHLTMDHHHHYLALMTRLHPESVYEYLSSHDNYRPEECLKLCQKHEIADASAYLLERMGNVSSALQLILQTLESRMMNLKRTIRGMGTDAINLFNAKNSAKRWRKSETPVPESYQRQEKEIDGVKRILVVALDVCERNSGSSANSASRTEHGSQLWFNVLDRLINAKGFLRLSKEQPGHAKVMAGVLSELLRMTMQRMVSSVPLPDLVRKVTSDHSGSRLGELREMIESLLATYGLELKVFSRSVSIFKYDSQQMQKMSRDYRVKGSNVRTVMNVPLDKENRGNLTLEKSSAGGDILQLVERGNACVLDADYRSKSRGSGPGLGSALSRLKSRRGGAKHTTKPAATGLNYMTSDDVFHSQGEIDPDAMHFEDRISGVLGEAEHRGRVMSFLY
eukprot:scaffold7169_cov107-Cylindrotheca_fusiformis.AAC.8